MTSNRGMDRISNSHLEIVLPNVIRVRSWTKSCQMVSRHHGDFQRAPIASQAVVIERSAHPVVTDI